MTDQNLRTLLLDRIDHEPPFTMDPHAAVRAGRRRRHLQSGLIAAALAGIVGVGGTLALTGGASDDRTDAPDVSVADDPTATTSQPDQPLGGYLGQLSAAGYGDAVAGLGAGQLTVMSASGGEVTPEDTSAQSFDVRYQSGARMVVLGRKGRPAGPVTSICANTSATTDTCEEQTLADGSLLFEAVGPVSMPSAKGTYRMYTPDDVAQGRPDDLFYRHWVALVSPEGFYTFGGEFVRADSLAQAQSAWTVPAETIEELVQDDGLNAYDLPHE